MKELDVLQDKVVNQYYIVEMLENGKNKALTELVTKTCGSLRSGAEKVSFKVFLECTERKPNLLENIEKLLNTESSD